MKIFCDMEFTGLRQDTELISVGIVANDGRRFYAESNSYDLTNAEEEDQQWIKENVLPYLLFNDVAEAFPSGTLKGDIKMMDNTQEYLMKGTFEDIGDALKEWLNKYEEVTFIADVLAWDWILFCDLLGKTAKELPSHISYTPIDIASLMYALNIDPMNTTREKFVDVKDIQQGKVWQKQHNALYDAIVVQRIYNKLMNRLNIQRRSSDTLDRIITKMDNTDKSNHVIVPEDQMKEIDSIIIMKKEGGKYE